jgi:flagellin-specific chaperone FliS
MAQSDSELLEELRKILLQFDYEPHGFPLEKFETIAEAMALLDELCKRSVERRRDKCILLEKVLHNEKFCEQIIKVLEKLENLEFHITNLRCLLEKISTFTPESAKQVSELYNRLNYAVYDASGPEEVHIIKSVTTMAEATRNMSYHMRRHCQGDDIFDDMMDEHFPDGRPSDNSSDSSFDDW